MTRKGIVFGRGKVNVSPGKQRCLEEVRSRNVCNRCGKITTLQEEEQGAGYLGKKDPAPCCLVGIRYS